MLPAGSKEFLIPFETSPQLFTSKAKTESDEEYLSNKDALPVCLTMPLRKEEYSNENIPPFFYGLIPEGWLLEFAQTNWKINTRDRIKLLLTFCKDTIGATGVERIKE